MKQHNNNTSKADIYSLMDYPRKGDIYGKYKGKYPSQAAKKFVSFLSSKHKFSNSKSKKALIFNMVNNRTNKQYKYIGTRIKLHAPTIVYINNKKVSYNYKNVATLYKDYYNNKMTGGGVSVAHNASHINGNHPHHTNVSSLLEHIQHASKGDGHVLAPVIKTTTHYSGSLIKH